MGYGIGGIDRMAKVNRTNRQNAGSYGKGGSDNRGVKPAPKRPGKNRRDAANYEYDGSLRGRKSSIGSTSVTKKALESVSRSASKQENENPNLLIGRNPITEAIKAGRTIDKILMQKDVQGSALKIAKMARESGIQLQYVDKVVLDRLAPGRSHQGVAAYAAAHAYADVEDIIRGAKAKNEDPVVVILDNLEDPHNLGAIMRTVDGAGFHGVIIPDRRSVSLTETVAKASAGAIEYVPVAKVTNLSQTVEYLKSQGLWIAAVDMDGEDYTKADLKGPLAIIIGAEGAGVSELLRKKADFIVSIPMRGRINSLNASNAAAIVLYEALRQRS